MKTFCFLFIISILLSTVSITDCCSSRKIPKARPTPSMVTTTPPSHTLNHHRLPNLTDLSSTHQSSIASHSNTFNEPQPNKTSSNKSTNTYSTSKPPNPTNASEAAVLSTDTGIQEQNNIKETTSHKNDDNNRQTKNKTKLTNPLLENKNDEFDENDKQIINNDQQHRRQPDYAYKCERDLGDIFCLHGSECYYVNIGNGTLTYCVCPDGYFGERCGYKSLDGSYHAGLLQTKQIRIETASICFGAGIAFLLVILVLYTFYYYTKSSLRHRY